MIRSTHSGVIGSMYVRSASSGIRHDRGRIAVDQDHAVALFPERAHRLCAGIVELAALADDDRTGAEEQDAVDVVTSGQSQTSVLQAAKIASVTARRQVIMPRASTSTHARPIGPTRKTSRQTACVYVRKHASAFSNRSPPQGRLRATLRPGLEFER